MFRFAYSPSQPSLTRRGMTLIELLIVLIILTLVTAATIPLMQPPSADRKLREAARDVVTTFELARARAIETGRAAGVWLEPISSNSAESITLYIADAPPPYAGDVMNATATINGANIALQNSGSAPQLVKYGDLIRFNNRGTWYRITGGSNGNFIMGTSISIAQPTGFALPQNAQNVPFQIKRAPVKSSVTPTVLPSTPPAAVVDLAHSGLGVTGVFYRNNSSPDDRTIANGKRVLVMFLPNGAVDQVYLSNGNFLQAQDISGTLYFLVRLRREAGSESATGDFAGYWIAIQPSTGLISLNDIAAPLNDNKYRDNEIGSSRDFAKTGQSKGGN